MNNKEKLYLVKLAVVANTPEQFQTYQRLIPPTPGSRRYRELPKAERQSILSVRDKEQARGLAMTNKLTDTKSFISNLGGSFTPTRPRGFGYDMRNAPTAKGGLNNIPPRPAAHPFSDGNTVNHRYQDGINQMHRMDQNLPIMPAALKPDETGLFQPYRRKLPTTQQPQQGNSLLDKAKSGLSSFISSF
jgi:hypothetical protein